jgi:hypothetical protein
VRTPWGGPIGDRVPPESGRHEPRPPNRLLGCGCASIDLHDGFGGHLRPWGRSPGAVFGCLPVALRDPFRPGLGARRRTGLSLTEMPDITTASVSSQNEENRAAVVATGSTTDER